jgi:hypothetical protein
LLEVHTAAHSVQVLHGSEDQPMIIFLVLNNDVDSGCPHVLENHRHEGSCRSTNREQSETIRADHVMREADVHRNVAPCTVLGIYISLNLEILGPPMVSRGHPQYIRNMQRAAGNTFLKLLHVIAR